MSQYTAPNLSVDAANGTTYAYRRFGKSRHRSRGLLPTLPRQPRQLGPRPGRRHRGGARGHPARRERGRPVDRHRADVVPGVRPRRAGLHRCTGPHRGRPLRLLHRRIRRPGGRTAAAPPRPPDDPRRNGSPGRPGNARLDRRGACSRDEGRPGAGGHPVPVLQPLAGEPEQGQGVRRPHLHPGRGARHHSRPRRPRRPSRRDHRVGYQRRRQARPPREHPGANPRRQR